MKSIATHAYTTSARGLFLLLFLALGGCSLPYKPVRPFVYDFGPGRLTQVVATGATAAQQPPLAVPEIETHPALDSTAVLFRLSYADSQQLRPYAQARWSMTPAQLLRQRLREQLGQHRALLNPGDGLAATPGVAKPLTPQTLRIELDEFSQLFETPDRSVGLLRLRATVIQPGATGEKLVAQRNIVLQRPAPSADAAGGVTALTLAADAGVQEIEQWLQGLGL